MRGASADRPPEISAVAPCDNDLTPLPFRFPRATWPWDGNLARPRPEDAPVVSMGDPA